MQTYDIVDLSHGSKKRAKHYTSDIRILYAYYVSFKKIIFVLLF